MPDAHKQVRESPKRVQLVRQGKPPGQFPGQTQPVGDRLLLSLLIKYRASWEVYVTGEGLWIAQGKTRSHCRCRFEADPARHPEQKIPVI